MRCRRFVISLSDGRRPTKIVVVFLVLWIFLFFGMLSCEKRADGGQGGLCLLETRK